MNTGEFHPRDRPRFDEALRRFDAENARDPNREQVGASAEPRELVYSRWLTAWVLRLCPSASEELRLAARSQHLCRWMLPRESYPRTRAGYLRWREELKKFHAQKAGEILNQIGYPQEIIDRVQSLNLKHGFPQDPETRVLEDALCLVFLEHQFAELVRKTPEAKMLNVLKKTWEKMTPLAQSLVAKLSLEPKEKELLAKALAA